MGEVKGFARVSLCTLVLLAGCCLVQARRPARMPVGTVPVTSVVTTSPVVAVPAKTATPVAEAALDLRLAVGLYNENLIDFFNQNLDSSDFVAVRPPLLRLLPRITTGQKVLVLPTLGEDYDRLDRLWPQMSEYGVKYLMSNIEADYLPVKRFVQEQEYVYAFAREHGLTYIFAPTLPRLEEHYAEFVGRADAILLQSQRWQGLSDYESRVEGLIARIKELDPDMEVIVQVSVNPPRNRSMSAAEVDRHVRLIADKADGISLFNLPGQNEDRLQTVVVALH